MYGLCMSYGELIPRVKHVCVRLYEDIEYIPASVQLARDLEAQAGP